MPESKHTYASSSLDAPPGINLLQNPDFELKDSDGNASMWNRYVAASAAYSVVSNNVSNGYQAQQITAANIPNNSFAGIDQTIPVVSDQPFLISGRINVQQLASANVQLYVDFYNGDVFRGAQSWTLPAGATPEFVTLSGTDRIPANTTSARIYALIRSTASSGSGTVIIDSMNFMYLGDDNLLANGSFASSAASSREINDWSIIKSGTSQVAVSSYEANGTVSRTAKIEASNLPDNQFTAIYQKIRVNPGQSYNLSSRINVASLSNASVSLYVDFFNGTTYVSSSIYDLTNPTQDQYVTMSGSGDIPANATYMVIDVMIKGTAPNGSGTVYVDDVSFEYASEQNLLSNGRFEASTLGNIAASWQQSTSSGTTQYSIVNVNNDVMQKVSAANLSSNSFAGISQLVKVQSLQSYTVNGRVNIDALTNTKAQLYVDYYGNDFTSKGAAAIDLPTVSNGEFITLANRIATPANTAFMRVYILLRSTASNGSGSLLIDDLRCSLSTNLLSNASFESMTGINTADGWYDTNQPGIISDTSLMNAPLAGNTNTYSYMKNGALKSIKKFANGTAYNSIFKYDSNGNLLKKLNRQSVFNNQTVYHKQQSQRVAAYWIPNGQFYSVYQRLAVKPNLSYMVSANINIELLTNAKVQVYIDFLNASGTIVASHIKDYTGDTGQYALVQNSGTIPAGAVTATVHFLIRSTGADGGGIFYLDDANFSYTSA